MFEHIKERIVSDGSPPVGDAEKTRILVKFRLVSKVEQMLIVKLEESQPPRQESGSQF